MGLDITITSLSGDLGSCDVIRTRLGEVFAGVEFGQEPTGADKVRLMAEKGVELPASLREMMASMPASELANWKGLGLSIQFRWSADATVQSIDAVAYFGDADEEQLIAYLAQLRGWQSELHDTGRIVVGT